MKKILIAGKNSYVGTSFKEWVSQFTSEYKVDTISLRNDEWREKSFSGYDTVLHTVGIAHVDSNPNPKLEDLYYKVNRDFAIEAAKKAKKDGVKQFIFLSSIIVYGDSGKINEPRIINRNTIPKPANFYGDSKLQAEEGIKPLESDVFKVAIIRPPMIYGKNSKGNYPKLARAARKLPIFPDIDNKRSMLHIENLCEFLRLLIDYEDSGLFFPQNSEYVKTSEMVKRISNVYGKNIKLTKLFNPLLYLLSNKIDVINKVFGNLIYDQKLSNYKENYRVNNFNESIYKTEK